MPWPLPDSAFRLSFGDVPYESSDHDATPVLSIHGYLRRTLPIIRFVSSPVNDLIGAMQEHRHIPWAERRSICFYKDGKAWKSAMPGDSFRNGRSEAARLAKLNTAELFMPKSVRPYTEWRRFKYVLYVDGIGPSFRLQFLLQLRSLVFIPAMHIPSWPMAFIQPWRHYVPVHRNLSDLV